MFSDDYLTVDVPERKVAVNGERLKLTPREFRLLALLVENADHVLSHQQVLENVWGWEYIDDVDYVRIYISHLRQKIEPDLSQPRYILTEPGVGYYFHKTELTTCHLLVQYSFDSLDILFRCSLIHHAYPRSPSRSLLTPYQIGGGRFKRGAAPL